MKKPNILFMITHDTGRRLQSYGHPVQTPNLTRLAEEGIQFNEVFCSAPQCSPSRASILTGKYPHNNGMMGLAHLGFAIKDECTTLPKELRKNGYETILIGHSHETIGTPPPVEDRVFSSLLELGYDKHIPVEGYRAPKIANEIINFLEQNQNRDTPFYISAGIFETHRPFDEYEDIADDPDSVTVFDFLPDTPETRKDVSLYNASAKVLDEQIGRIHRTLEETGLLKNTMVIFTTDHGVDFPMAKGSLKQAGLETAFITLLPNGPKGETRQALLSNVDIMPTILDYIDAEIPENLDGQSFVKLFDSQNDVEIRDSIFTELTWHDRYHPMRSIRTKAFSYVKNFEDGPKVYFPIDSHLSLSGQVVRESCYVPNSPEELYDLEKDPLEQKNVIDDPNYQKIASELRQKVQEWMEQTNDPLLKGKIPGTGSRRWQAEIDAGRAYVKVEKIISEKLARRNEKIL